MQTMPAAGSTHWELALEKVEEEWKRRITKPVS